MARSPVVACIVALVVASLTAPIPAGAAMPGNGPLLSGDSGGAQLTTLAGDPVGEIAVSIDGAAVFSDAGDRIAIARNECWNDCAGRSGHLDLMAPDGSQTMTATVPAHIADFTWSPDGQALAALAYAEDRTALYRIPVDGSPAQLLVDSRPTFEIETKGLDWHPTDGTVTFVASLRNEDGTYPVVDSSQLFTVPATGGEVTRRTPADTCAPDACNWHEFAYPTWSPDGDTLVAHVSEVHEYAWPDNTVDHYLGALGQGDDAPSVVHLIDHQEDVHNFRQVYWPGTVWSEDGGQILFRTIDEEVVVSAWLLDLADDTVEPIPSVEYVDWQPCPTGGCVDWTDVDVDAPTLTATRLSLRVSVAHRMLSVSGRLAPARPDQKVRLRVERKKPGSGRWRTTDRGRSAIDDDGAFTAQLPAPRGRACRVIARYAGDSSTFGVKRTRKFSC